MIDRVHFKGKYLIPTVRLPGYDYSLSGTYAVTFCTNDRRSFLSRIIDSEIILTREGQILTRCWDNLPMHFHNCALDTFIVMPNHVHLILRLQETETGQRPVSTKDCTLGTIVGALKSYSSKEIHRIWGNDLPVWQSRFYEHVIRSEKSYQRMSNYFLSNPQNWINDSDYPKNIRNN